MKRTRTSVVATSFLTHELCLAMKSYKKDKILFLLPIFLLAATLSGTEWIIKDVTVTPRQSLNGRVDITYWLDCPNPEEKTCVTRIAATGWDYVRNMAIPMKNLRGDGVKTPVPPGGPYHIVWDASKDAPNLNTTAFVASLYAFHDYLVINLKKGRFEFRDNGPDLSDDTCRTEELWLRYIPAGTFIMGSPKDEWRRDYDETQHPVTLTQSYWIGIFEVTQKQYELIMGSNPSFYKGETRPVECVSYSDIRGLNVGLTWPSGGHTVDADSFLGKLRVKTGLAFDLPTEAQWENACRAGTTTPLNSGRNMATTNQCPNMAEVGRYHYNQADGKGGYGEHTKVGSYFPNRWGLYDMHGNVGETCLDWWQGNYSSAAVADPLGGKAGRYRVRRGGYWGGDPRDCRSANRDTSGPDRINDSVYGFRLVCPAP